MPEDPQDFMPFDADPDSTVLGEVKIQSSDGLLTFRMDAAQQALRHIGWRPPHPAASLAEALARFQADPPQVVKDAEADVMNKEGTRKLYSYSYMTLQALLAALRPKLDELGLVWRSEPGMSDDGRPVLHYSCTHIASNEKDEGTMPLVSTGTMQALGGAISFARRYALITYFNLAPDVDEDGALATQEQASRPTGDEAKKLTKASATEIVAQAIDAGIGGAQLQQAANFVHKADVGLCDTKSKAITALQKLNRAEGARVAQWVAQKAAELNEAPEA